MMSAQAQDAQKQWKWDKSVCRFCGTGCGIMIATQKDANGQSKIVAIKGDPEAPVNRGLNCIKGYFCAKIMYGADRLTKPLLRVNSQGEFDKKGKFAPVSWKRAFDEMEKHFKKAYNELGPTGIGRIWLWTIHRKKVMRLSNSSKEDSEVIILILMHDIVWQVRWLHS